MRRFILSNKKMTGSVEVWYDFEGNIAKIDLLSAQLTVEQIQFLFTGLFVNVDGFLKNPIQGMDVKEVEFDISVEEFLYVYPLARNSHLVKDAWPKINKKTRTQIYFGALDYREYCNRNKDWYNPRVAMTWIQKREYLNNWKLL